MRVKLEAHSNPNDNLTPSSTSYRSDNTHYQHQYAANRSTRIHENALPYRRPDPPHQQLAPVQYHPALLSQAIGQATHETLSASRNVAYLSALREITEVRAVAATYQRQVIQLHSDLMDARDAYTQLFSRIKSLPVQQEQQTRLPSDNSVKVIGPQSSLVVSRLPSEPVATANKSGLTPGPISTVRSSDAAANPSQANPNPNTAPPTPTISSACSKPDPDAYYGPISPPGSFKIIPHVGPWLMPLSTRPSDLPFEVFWSKADWFRKGYSNGTFVTDRNGKHLKYLMHGIRRTARRIWTELAKVPGSSIAASYNKNTHSFMDSYVNTIEEIYPCLKLCSDHWKAKQVGVSAYPHWYRNRGRYLDGTITV